MKSENRSVRLPVFYGGPRFLDYNYVHDSYTCYDGK